MTLSLPSQSASEAGRRLTDRVWCQSRRRVRSSSRRPSQLAVIYFTAGAYFMYFMPAVAVLKIAAHDQRPASKKRRWWRLPNMIKNANVLG